MSEDSIDINSSKTNSRTPIHWWHWISGLALVILLTLLAPRGKSPEFAHLAEGSISQTKIIAPFDFEVLKLPEDLESERREAAQSVLPVVIKVDSVGDMYRREILTFAAETHKVFANLSDEFYLAKMYAGEDSVPPITSEDYIIYKDGINGIFGRFGFRLSSESWDFLTALFLFDRDKEPNLYFRFFEIVLEGILRDVYGQGIINVPKSQLTHESDKLVVRYKGVEDNVDLARLLTPNEALERISILLPEKISINSFPDGAISAAYEMLQPFISSNIIFDSAETLRRRELAVNKVPTASGFVKKDELIIDRNIRVNQEHVLKLNSLATIRAERELERGGPTVPLQAIGQFILVGLVIGFFWSYIYLVRRKVWLDWKLMILVVIILGLVHLYEVYVPIQYELSNYLFLAAVLAMLLGILIDHGIALAGVVVMALISGLLHGNHYPVTFSIIAIGSISVRAIRHVTTRGDVMRVTIYLAATFIPMVAAFHFIRYTVDAKIWLDLLIACVNSVFSPILVLGLVFIFEKFFKITTDLSLLELVDLNRPLLRELAIKSPGTYHHSIMVGSLAETAARAIGANALLTRAGAYYHDIGKMDNRDYFIENQEAGSENPHDQLPPSKSAEIVIHHVIRGLKLAEKHGLPPQVTAFIGEHHGRTRIAYFYSKAIDEIGRDVNPELYLYPGPNPQSRETGILMLADVVEAATRTIEIDNNEELSSVVDNLIRKRIAEGAFEECPLTMKEIGQIRKSFVQVLAGIHHQRIKYPDQERTPDVPDNGDEESKRRNVEQVESQGG